MGEQTSLTPKIVGGCLQHRVGRKQPLRRHSETGSEIENALSAPPIHGDHSVPSLSFQALLYKHELEQRLPEFAAKHLMKSLDGDVDSARKLIFSAPNGYRGACTVLLYLARVPKPALQVALTDAWLHDHDHVIAAAGNRNRLQAMFRRAAFEMPDQVQIWRGVSRTISKLGARGLSWTLDRGVACWFAATCRFHDTTCPLVLTATVARTDLVFWNDERQEREVICFNVSQAQVDGTPEEWRQTGNLVETERRKAPEGSGRDGEIVR